MVCLYTYNAGNVSNKYSLCGGSTDETIPEKRREEKRSLSWLSFLSVLVSILVLLGSSPISLLAEGTEPVETFYSVDESLSFSADAVVTSSWDSHANIELAFTNCGEDTIHNWFFIFDLPYVIENIWNASVVSHQEGVYSVKNAGWNQDIPVGGSVTIGFTAASTDGTDVTVMPTFFLLNTEKIEVDADAVSLSYQEYSAWDSGFTGALTLSHTLDHSLTDWSVSFKCNRPINTVNTGVLSQSDDGAYQITNDGNHQNIEVGANRLIGIQGGAADAQVPFALSDVHVFMWTQAFSLEEDANANGVADYLDFIAGDDPDPEIDYETDTDGDGIPDYFEIEWGTDPLSVDTDGDGIDDMTEMYCGMDPLTSDLDEDFDGDGLTLQQEQALGTEFWNEDTDYDGLLDGDEINIYGTDPLQEDTDGDGLLDGDEIDLGLDPLNANTHGVPDNEYTQTHVLLSDSDVFSDINTEDAPYTMSVDITASGNVPKYLSVSESSYSAAVYNEAMLGTVAELDYEGSYLIDEVKLTFEVRDEYISNPDSPYAAVNPEFEGIRRYCVFRYFEDINMLLPVETQYDEEDQTAYAITDLVGTYCLMDMDLWLESIGIMPEDIAVDATASGVSDLSSEELSISFLNTVAPTDTTDGTITLLTTNHCLSDYASASLLSAKDVVAQGVYKGHKYAIMDIGLTWDEAKAYCEYMAGHLVTITDEGEQDYINSLLLSGAKNSYWIGAEMNVNGSYTHWITGESMMDYTHFYTSQPDHYGNQEDVLMMYRNDNVGGPCFGFWNDLNRNGTCFDQVFFGTENLGLICEWETSVNILYGMSLRPCNRAWELSNLADEDWDGDGIPNWQEIRIDPNLGYWNIDGKYIPATLHEYMSMYSGLGNPFSRFNLNPVIIPVIPLVSHPEKEDSDGDGYMDDRDPRPFRCDVFYTEIANSNYVPIRGEWDSANNMTPISYGGNQVWFSLEENKSQEWYINKKGCGVIALCDLLLYKAIQSPDYTTEATEIAYVNQMIEQASYMEYIMWMCSQYSGYPGWMGLYGTAIVSAFNLYAGEYGIDLQASWEWSLSDKTMIDKIEEMLNRDIPVILSVGPNTPNFKGDEKVNIYNRISINDSGYNTGINELYQYQKYKGTNGHYMVITGVIYDRVAGNTMLCVSSWGKTFYVDYNEYRDYVENVGGTWTSSIVYIE
ncbi:MAG: cellulose binding domain-containing protein [Clostridiales bacterium]|nr:cellulose binding domain-containing protein [Clostridiales bacterium]